MSEDKSYQLSRRKKNLFTKNYSFINTSINKVNDCRKNSKSSLNSEKAYDNLDKEIKNSITHFNRSSSECSNINRKIDIKEKELVKVNDDLYKNDIWIGSKERVSDKEFIETYDKLSKMNKNNTNTNSNNTNNNNNQIHKKFNLPLIIKKNQISHSKNLLNFYQKNTNTNRALMHTFSNFQFNNFYSTRERLNNQNQNLNLNQNQDVLVDNNKNININNEINNANLKNLNDISNNNSNKDEKSFENNQKSPEKNNNKVLQNKIYNNNLKFSNRNDNLYNNNNKQNIICLTEQKKNNQINYMNHSKFLNNPLFIITDSANFINNSPTNWGFINSNNYYRMNQQLNTSYINSNNMNLMINTNFTYGNNNGTNINQIQNNNNNNSKTLNNSSSLYKKTIMSTQNSSSKKHYISESYSIDVDEENNNEGNESQECSAENSINYTKPNFKDVSLRLPTSSSNYSNESNHSFCHNLNKKPLHRNRKSKYTNKNPNVNNISSNYLNTNPNNTNNNNSNSNSNNNNSSVNQVDKISTSNNNIYDYSFNICTETDLNQSKISGIIPLNNILEVNENINNDSTTNNINKNNNINNNININNNNINNINNNTNNISTVNPSNSTRTPCYTDPPSIVKGKIYPENIAKYLDLRTTLMIRNIPIKYKDIDLENELYYFKGQFDCLYMPFDFEKNGNKGYAFINFIHPYYILLFYECFNQKLWNSFDSKKVCDLNYANFQGINEIKKHANRYKGPKHPIFYKDLREQKQFEIPHRFFKIFLERFPGMKFKINKNNCNFFYTFTILSFN